MPIPSANIDKPEVVWATLDEKLALIRERLESSTIQNKWRASILVTSEDGQYGVVSVFALRPTVWKHGPLVLQRSLRDLGLLRLQPGVEREEVSLEDAERMADQYGGWLVVLHRGHYVGLVRGGTHSPALPVKPADAFDLFDALLPDSVLTQTEFVTTTLSTPVAEVARALQFKEDPERAFILVHNEDGNWQVLAARDLNREVAGLGDDVWDLPLRRFQALLQSAESRPYESVGYKQAQALADRKNLLILTDEGRPVGLLPSRIVWRTAPEIQPASPAAGEPTPSLFQPSASVLGDGARQAGSEVAPRYVNLWFESQDHRPLDRHEPLILGRAYHLSLNVGRLLAERSIVAWEQTNSGPRAVLEPQEKDAYLYVSLFSDDFYIPEPTKMFRLPREGNANPVHLRVEPLRVSRGAEAARLEVCFYYRAYLVQAFEVQVEVVASGEAARTSLCQIARLAHARAAWFPDMAELAPHELSLTITRDGPDRYRFTFLADPNPEDEAEASRAVELSCCVQLSRDELTHLITKARRQLYNVIRATDLSQERDLQTYRRATRALAQVGRQLYLKLFQTDAGRALARWMEESLPLGSTIQIADLAGDFVFPWSLVYTAQPWDSSQPTDVQSFWGWRYKLVILTPALLDTYRRAETTIAVDAPLRISVGLYERLAGADRQKGFFDSLAARSDGRVTAEILTSRETMSRALEAADRDLYYFFCHGYTERMATDIQLNLDLVNGFARQASGTSAKSPSIHEHLDDLFDVSDSWMRLTRGRILLTMLKETVPDQFSRYPLVFLNMCESAQVLPSLADGFVPFFLQRQARAVIGTECSMDTTFADELAREFLGRFLAGEGVGDILLALRRHYLEQDNPLALAYTLYGDADLRLSEPLLPAESQEVGLQPAPLSPGTDNLEQAVEALWDDDLDGLMLALAARVQAAEAGLASDQLQLWAPAEEAFAADEEAGPEWTQAMILFGQRWWGRLEPELYSLLCNPYNHQRYTLLEALKDGARLLAIALAPALVAQLQALPAVAVVLATIAAKLIADSGIGAVCEMWSEAMINQQAAPEAEGMVAPEGDTQTDIDR
jgi:hypothetical protein